MLKNVDTQKFDYSLSAGDAIIFDEGGVHKGSKSLKNERIVLRYLYSTKNNDIKNILKIKSSNYGHTGLKVLGLPYVKWLDAKILGISKSIPTKLHILMF